MRRCSLVTQPWSLRFAAAATVALHLAAAPPVLASSAGEQLHGAALKSFIAGRRVYLSTPFGGEIPLTYHVSGVVDGSGEAVGLGKYMTPKDRGRWWVTGNRLCQKWQEWYGGKTFCFTVSKIDAKHIRWVRDDGKTGIARVR